MKNADTEGELRYTAGFQRIGDALYPWYCGGKLTLKKDRFILSFLGFRLLEVKYMDILKVEWEPYCFEKCLNIQFLDGKVYIKVGISKRDEVEAQIRQRMKDAWI